MKNDLKHMVVDALTVMLLVTALLTFSAPAYAGCNVSQVQRCTDLCGEDYKCWSACLDYCLNPTEESVLPIDDKSFGLPDFELLDEETLEQVENHTSQEQDI